MSSFLFKNLLIIEDEIGVSMIVKKLSEKAGFEAERITLAKSHADALKKIDSSVHYAFVDLNLPDGNGSELIPMILKANPRAKIIVISGSTEMTSITKAISEGAKAFVKKPLSPSKFENALNKLN